MSFHSKFNGDYFFFILMFNFPCSTLSTVFYIYSWLGCWSWGPLYLYCVLFPIGLRDPSLSLSQSESKLYFWHKKKIYFIETFYWSPCTQSKHGCLRPRKRFISKSLEMFLKMLLFSFWSSWVCNPGVSDLPFCKKKF